MRIIGDLHAKWDQYIDILGTCKNSIQVGDFGWGFPGDDPYQVDSLHKAMDMGNHRYIRGNHDNPNQCNEHKYCLSQPYTYFSHGKKTIFCTGGAYSIDQAYRIPGVSWWDNEEHSYTELMDISSAYEKLKPSIMITHDCPETIAKSLFNHMTHNKIQSRTRNAYDSMFMMHKPDLWIFGHHHISTSRNILGTEFICLNELEYIDI